MGRSGKIHNTEHWGAGVVTIPNFSRFYFLTAIFMPVRCGIGLTLYILLLLVYGVQVLGKVTPVY